MHARGECPAAPYLTHGADARSRDDGAGHHLCVGMPDNELCAEPPLFRGPQSDPRPLSSPPSEARAPQNSKIARAAFFCVLALVTPPPQAGEMQQLPQEAGGVRWRWVGSSVAHARAAVAAARPPSFWWL